MNKALKYCRLLLCALLSLSFISSAFGRGSYSPPDTLQLLPLLDTSIVKLKMSNVPTEILEDFGKNPVNLKRYDGVSTLCDTNVVNFRTLNRILSGLSSSRVNRNTLIPQDITEQLSEQFEYGYNPVAIVAYKYNCTQQNALANNLIRVENGRYYDQYVYSGTDSTWVNPYEDKYVVAFSPYMNISGSQVSYYFDPNQLFTNLPIVSIEFDPGDSVYRTISLTTGGYVNITYTSASTSVDLKLRITLSGGLVLLTHSIISIIFPPSQSTGGDYADYTFIETCDSTYLGYSETVRAMVSVKYATGTTLTKPFIIAEGFDPFPDPDGIMQCDKTGRGFNHIDNLGIKSTLRSLGYDIIYIDWLDSYAPIQANANILKKVLNWVNTHKTGTEKNILMGTSMGGLVSRYALCTMENAGTPHDVKIYVSDDSPHYGVNVPIGYVYALQMILGNYSFVNNLLLSDAIMMLARIFSSGSVNHANEYIHQVFSLCEAPSVRQMLMHFVSPELTYDSQMYNDFQAILNSLGFPQGDSGCSILNLALSNGGNNNYSTGLTYFLNISSGDFVDLLEPILNTLELPSVITGALGTLSEFSGISLNVNIRPNYQGTTQHLYESFISWTSYNGLLAGTIHPFYIDYFNPPSTSKVYDSDAGSFYPYSANSAIKQFMFVPSVSSLAYKNQSNNVLVSDRIIDFATTGLDINNIPFNGFKFVNSSASYHTDLSSTDIDWVDRMSCLSMSIDTLSTGYSCSIYDTDPTKDSFSVIWSIDNTSVANINSTSGVVTFVSGGTTFINADITYSGGHLRLKKEITVSGTGFPGFPSYTLTQIPAMVFPGEPFSGDYTIQATESASVSSDYASNMICHWGIKENHNSTIQWTTSPYNLFGHKLYFYCNIPNTANARTVYFYVSYFGQVTPTYSVVCNIPPSLFLLDGDGNLYTEDMDNPFAQVKSGLSDELYYFTCVDQTLLYDHWPTWAELGKDLLNSEEFVALIKTLRPWGTEDIILIPYSYYSNTSEETEYGYLTVKYDPTL